MRKKKNTLKNRFLLKNNNLFLYAVVFFIGFIIISIFVFIHLTNSPDKAIRGIYLNNINLHNLTKEEAIIELEKNIEQYSLQNNTLRVDEQTYKYSILDTGAKIDIFSTIEDAYSYGRNESFIKNISTQLKTFVITKNIPIIAVIDEEQFNDFAKTHLASFETQSKNASIKYSPQTEKFNIIKEQNKVFIKKESFKEKLLETISTFSNETIILTKATENPDITKESIKQIQEQANKILNNEFTVKLNDKKWVIPTPVLASWIETRQIEGEQSSHIYFDQDKIETYINNNYFLDAIKKPTDGKFIIDNNGHFTEIQPSQDGTLLDIKESAKSIIASLEHNGSIALLHLRPIFADVSKENTQNLEVATLLGYGESDFIGSPHNRIHNINLGTKKYQGIVIAPGGEFSFNELLGPINKENGYLPSHVIKNKKIIQEYGGGLCQLSTTMFRAAIDAGLQITARSNHSYVVEYYGKPGLDATIYPPNPDLKFKNNTAHHILIQNRIEGTKLYFEIYGKHDGRSTTIEGPTAYEVQGNGAMKTYVTQTVRDKDNNIIEQQTFKSNYGPTKKNNEDKNPLE